MLDAAAVGGLSIANIVIAVTLTFLILGSIIDLKTGEIPDRLTIGLALIMMLISAIYSIITSDVYYFITPLFAGGLYFLLGYVIYSQGEWGGGDVKLISGVGCSIGFLKSVDYLTEGVIPYYLDYLINIALVSSPYLIVYTLLLGLLKPAVFTDFFNSIKNKIVLMILAASIIPLITAYWMKLGNVIIIYALIPFLIILSVYLRAVERNALEKTVKVSELQVEDVVANDLVVDGVKVASRRNISGLTEEDIKKIKSLSKKGKIPDEIRIKWGVRFAPIFLMAFLLSILVGNTLEIVTVHFTAF